MVAHIPLYNTQKRLRRKAFIIFLFPTLTLLYMNGWTLSFM